MFHVVVPSVNHNSNQERKSPPSTFFNSFETMMQSQVFANALLSHAKVAGEERRMERLKQRSVRKSAAKVITSFMKKQVAKSKARSQHLPSLLPLTKSALKEDIKTREDSGDSGVFMVPSIIKIFRIQKTSVFTKSTDSWHSGNHQTTSLQTMMKPLNGNNFADFREALCLIQVVI